MGDTTWVEVSRGALTRNYEAVAKNARVPVCAVVKANGYGHGLVESARTFVRAGARMVGVTRIEEARAVREDGINAPILIMAPIEDISQAVALRCAITVGSVDAVEGLPADVEVHLKVDTGMGRLGVRPSEAVTAARAIGAHARLSGVWTHFADAAGTSGPAQLARFRSVLESLTADHIAFTAHAANSAATLALTESRLDMVRVGTLLYGQHPVGAVAPWALHPTLSWFAKVTAVRTVPAGTPVGYGSEWRASKETRLATIPVGYADGFGVDPNARTPSVVRAARRLGSTALRRGPREVMFDDVPAPVVGRVAMQSLTVDVSRVPGVEVGSVATLPGRRLMIDPTIPRVWS